MNVHAVFHIRWHGEVFLFAVAAHEVVPQILQNYSVQKDSKMENYLLFYWLKRVSNNMYLADLDPRGLSWNQDLTLLTKWMDHSPSLRFSASQSIVSQIRLSEFFGSSLSEARPSTLCKQPLQPHNRINVPTKPLEDAAKRFRIPKALQLQFEQIHKWFRPFLKCWWARTVTGYSEACQGYWTAVQPALKGPAELCMSWPPCWTARAVNVGQRVLPFPMLQGLCLLSTALLFCSAIVLAWIRSNMAWRLALISLTFPSGSVASRTTPPCTIRI